VRRWQDVTAAVCLAVIVGALSWYNQGQIDEALHDVRTTDVWFQADVWRVVDNETRRHSDHYRNKVHPLYSLLSFPLVAAAQGALGVDAHAAVRLFHTLVAALWGALLHATLRLCGRSTAQAALFALLGAASAASLFWLGLPETYGPGSVAILLAVCAAAAAEQRRLPAWQHVGVNVLTLSYTVTNWMAGLLATFAAEPFRRALRLAGLAFAVTAALAVLQKAIFPSSGLFFLGSREEFAYVLRAEAGGLWATTRAHIFHAMTLPDIRYVPGANADWAYLSVQQSPLLSGGMPVLVAAGAWAALLALGATALRAARERRLAFVLSGIAAGQLALHALYGEETFLYSLHLMPVLVVIASFGVRIAPRTCLALAALLAVVAGSNNMLKLQEAQSSLRDAAPRALLQHSREERQ
jgi:hypothetical protein